MSARVVRRQALVPPGAFPPGLHPVLARVYAGREVRAAADIDYSLAGLHPHGALRGMRDAVALLADAVRRGRRILVLGDFDADGATSCAVAVRGLRLMGARAVDYLVPNRFEYGYGLTPEIVEVAARRSPNLLITVDNGISSIEGVAAAREHGMQVLVTDHHLPRGDSLLPRADAIVNPNQPGDAFPSKSLAGVGVIFYVLAALRAGLREAGWFSGGGVAEPNLARLLDLVALGTVADLVPLDRNNRILVAQGLARIRAGRGHPGITALLRVAGRDPARAVAADLAFAAAPRLNAAGRLDDMSRGIECLLADEAAAAQQSAALLDRLNRERREIEADMQAQAMARLDALRLAREDALPFGLCLYDEQWHPGVIGILAARVKEQVHRPVIAFADEDAEALKGSARSVPGVHIRDVLDAVAVHNPGLITRFGGHAMAAGLSLPRARYQDFGEAFDREVRRVLREEDLRGTLHSDGELEAGDIGLDLAETLRAAGPWGQGFPEPLFDGEFEVLGRRVVGGRHLKMELVPAGAATPVDAIAFNVGEDAAATTPRRVHLAYRLDVNVYRGARSAQLVVEHIAPAASRR